MTDIRAGMAFVAGMTGGAAMSAFMLVARATDIHASFEWLLALLVFGPADRPLDGWALGFGLHLLVSGAIGLAYGRILERLPRDFGWRTGASIGAVHGVIAAGAVALAQRPMTPGGLPADERTLALLVSAHLLYGVIVEAMYPRVRVRLRLVVNRRTRPAPSTARAAGLASGS